MIDQLTVLLPHTLMAIAIWRLLRRDGLDNDPALPRRTFPMQRKSSDKQAPSGDA